MCFYRDANSWCPFCERVWFALEEKKILFATEFIDLFNKLKWDINTALNAYETRRIPRTNVIYDRSATEGRNSYQTASESTFAKMIKPSQMSQDDFEAWYSYNPSTPH